MVKIGIIGTGGMAGHQAGCFAQIKTCRIVACADTVPGRAAAFAEKHGIASAYEDAREMLDREKLDGVTVVTPDIAHCRPVLEVVKRGIHCMCEKPLADNLKDARRMAAAAKRKGILTAVNFSYRNSAATQKAAQLVASGKIGRVIHVEGNYLQSWLVSRGWGDWSKTEALLWRLSTRHGSLGCLGDIGVHLYDFVTFIAGDISEIQCNLQTFDKPVNRIGEYVFDANDSFVSTVRFKNGALGTLSSSRWATGHPNTVAMRAYGDKGAIDLNLDRPPEDQLRICVGRKAIDTSQWKPVKCPATPDMYRRFITAIRTGKQGQTTFQGAARVQAYLDASVRSSETGTYIRIR